MTIFQRINTARLRRLLSHPVSQAALLAGAVLIVAAFVLPSVAAAGESSEITLERVDNLALRGAIERTKDELARAGFSMDKPGGASPDGASLILSPETHGCDRIESIMCSQTRSDDLTPASCRLNDGSYVEFYSFFGTVGQRVQIDMMSSAFDTYLLLLNPTPAVVATNDDFGGSTNSRISFTINVPGTWAIAANSFLANQFGPYTVSLACPDDGCVANSTTLCLNASRFRVSGTFRTQSQTGPFMAQPVATAPDSGLFWFFSANNLEMLIKVLNGCSLNNRYWVFFAAGTNVEFTVTVTDTLRGGTRTYTNPLNNPAAPVQDTNAFATCP